MGLAYADVYLNLAHDYNRALKYAREEYDARPENIDVNKMMAVVHLKLNKTDEAAKYLEVARKTGSKHPDLDYIEAVIFAKKGEEAKAKAMIRSAQKVNPNMAFALQEEINNVLM
jgi:tetratricopeptide (TPR) repeat protein